MKNQGWRGGGEGERVISCDSDPAVRLLHYLLLLLLLPAILLPIACLAPKLVVPLLHGSADPVTSHAQVAPHGKNRDPRMSRRLDAQAPRCSHPLHYLRLFARVSFFLFFVYSSSFLSLLFSFYLWYFFFARLSIAEHRRSGRCRSRATNPTCCNCRDTGSSNPIVSRGRRRRCRRRHHRRRRGSPDGRCRPRGAQAPRCR